MKKSRKLKWSLEQLGLFDEKPNRPMWSNLPSDVQKRVSDLVAQILVETLRTNQLPNARKEVVDER